MMNELKSSDAKKILMQKQIYKQIKGFANNNINNNYITTAKFNSLAPNYQNPNC